MKILIIDDNASILQELTEMLEKEGHYVLAATEIPEALNLLYREHPDLIISDNNLSCLTGLELRNLVKLQFMKHIPILLFKTADCKKKFLAQPALNFAPASISRFD